MDQRNYPKTGVAALIFNDGHLLLGQRKKVPGKNTWQCPGGLLELGESVFECARRETMEETGLVIRNLTYGPYTNNRFPSEADHSVTLYVRADYLSGEISHTEQNLGDNWQWFDINHLPSPLFLPLQLLIDRHKDWLRSAGVIE